MYNSYLDMSNWREDFPRSYGTPEDHPFIPLGPWYQPASSKHHHQDDFRYLHNMSGSGTRRYKVVGTSHYQASLRFIDALSETRTTTYNDQRIVWAALVPEAKNPHDKRAVRVDLICSGISNTVGYIPKSYNPEFYYITDNLIQVGILPVCEAALLGGDNADRKLYGVHLLGIDLKSLSDISKFRRSSWEKENL